MATYTVSGSPKAEAVCLLLDRIYSCLAEREQAELKQDLQTPIVETTDLVSA